MRSIDGNSSNIFHIRNSLVLSYRIKFIIQNISHAFSMKRARQRKRKKNPVFIKNKNSHTTLCYVHSNKKIKSVERKQESYLNKAVVN